MTTRFIHTADWQIGKPFARIGDDAKRNQVKQERLTALRRIRDAALAHQAEFIVVAGDLFDSPQVTQSDVSAACSAIGAMQVPVFVIPGNHDHGGPGSLWQQPFFLSEQAQLAPNLRVLLSPEPVETGSAVLFPCPLLRRHESLDTTAWLAGLPLAPGSFGGKPRIVLAHGSVLDFGPGSDEDEGDAAPANHIDLSRLPAGMFDYVALGDWHGMKQVGPHAWYSGTPEPDRFPKGPDNQPGHILVVEATRGDVPRVTPERTARLGWHALAVSLAGDDSLAQLDATLHNCLGTRVGEDLLRLELSGELGITAATELEKRLEAWSARLLRLKLSQRITLAPTEEELDALTRRTSDPLISRVAQRLVADLTAGGETGEVARVALRELHAAVVATA